MTGIRTDLAQEAHQLHRDVEGVECRDETCHGYEAHVVQVRTHEAAQVLGKPVGTYVTVELDGLLRREEAGFSRAVEAIAGLLAPMLPTKGLALVVGLGNRAMTPDLVGPRAVDFTLVTRHLVEALPQFSHLRAVAALAAGVLGTTGVESGVLVQAVVDKLPPAVSSPWTPWPPGRWSGCAARCSCPMWASSPAPGWETTAMPSAGTPWGCRC